MVATIPDKFFDLMSEKSRMFSESTWLAILLTLMQGRRFTVFQDDCSGRGKQ